MNKLQIAEIRKQASAKSITSDDKFVFCLIKNGTNLGKITTDIDVLTHYVKKENFSIYGIYLNGRKFETISDIEAIMDKVWRGVDGFTNN